MDGLAGSDKPPITFGSIGDRFTAIMPPPGCAAEGSHDQETWTPLERLESGVYALAGHRWIRFVRESPGESEP